LADIVAEVVSYPEKCRISHLLSKASDRFRDDCQRGNRTAIYDPVYEAHDFSTGRTKSPSRRASCLFWLWLQPPCFRALIALRDGHWRVQGLGRPRTTRRFRYAPWGVPPSRLRHAEGRRIKGRGPALDSPKGVSANAPVRRRITVAAGVTYLVLGDLDMMRETVLPRREVNGCFAPPAQIGVTQCALQIASVIEAVLIALSPEREHTPC